MPIVRNAIRPIVFKPDSLRMLGEIFDQVWASASPEFEDHLDRIEDARIRLATIVLELAKDGQLGRHQILRTASRLIRQARDIQGTVPL
jgi:hypothetical protein